VLQGRWLEAMPGGSEVLAETSLPRFLMTLPIGGREPSDFLDMGPGAEIEDLVFAPREQAVYMTAAVSNPHRSGSPVTARALLEIDTANWMLIGSVPLDTDRYARGMAVERHQSRVYLYEEDGEGAARLSVVDLYRQIPLRSLRVGTMPAVVGRKGLAVDRESKVLFCLVGGDGIRDDFAPVGRAPQAPALVALSAEDLVRRGSVELPDGSEPRALGYDQDLEKLCVLTTDRKRSRLVLVDAGFLRIRTVVDLPEPTSDLVVLGGYAFAPGAHGVYIVDLNSETWVSRPGVNFDRTGEVAVAGDLRRALVQFRSGAVNAAPGVALLDLTTGSVLEVWN